MSITVAEIRIVLDQKQNGVTWSGREGGVCPCCRQPKCAVYKTLPWEETTRTRYHICPRCGARFKSIEEE